MSRRRRERRRLDERILLQSLEMSYDNPATHFDNETFVKYPFSKRLELLIDGSSPTYVRFEDKEFRSILVNTSRNWAFPIAVVRKLIISHRFTDNTLKFSEWGAGGITATLSNGLFVGYTLNRNASDEFRNELFSNQVIQDNGDLESVFHSVEQLRDDKNPKDNVLSAKFNIDEILPNGIILNFSKNDSFWVLVQDDMTNADFGSLELNARVQGYGWVKR